MDFIVTMDILMNDTGWFSDVVLPEASYLERYDPLVPMGERIFIRQPVIEPQGEAKSALWVFKELGTAWDWVISSNIKTKKTTCASN